MENRKIIGENIEHCPLVGEVQAVACHLKTLAACVKCPWYLGKTWDNNDKMIVCAWRHNKDKSLTHNDWLDGFVKNKK